MNMVAELATLAAQEAQESFEFYPEPQRLENSPRRSTGPSVLTESATYWTPDRVKALDTNFAKMSFTSPENARAYLARQWVKASDGPENSLFPDHVRKAIAEITRDAPTFEDKLGFHLGEFCPWRYIEIRREDGRELHDVAQAQSENDYDIIPIKNYSLDALLGSPEGDSYLSGREGERTRRLAEAIKENQVFTAIIVDVTDPNEMFIIEGQHRARAARLLGFNTVPAHGIRYEDD